MIVQRNQLPVVLQGSIVDIETTGLSPKIDSVITVGLVHNNVCEIFQRTHEADICQLLDQKLRSLPRPIYAFNKRFEESFLGIVVDRELQSRPFESRNEAIQVSGVCDPLGSGLRVPGEWWAYAVDRGLYHLNRIIAHNLADLRHELCLATIRAPETNHNELQGE